MSDKSRKYPIKHVSVRVPWHDSGWDGRICQDPLSNSSCLKLKRISEEKSDETEQELAGKSVKDLDENQYPPCLAEKGAFMAPFDFYKTVKHPYARKRATKESHGHLVESDLRYPSYSFAAVPFAWMFRDNLQALAEEYEIPLDPEIEPDIDHFKTWVQHGHNQKKILDTFGAHIEEKKYLAFIYAKEVPFVEESGRILVGIGRITHKSDLTPYKSSEKGKMPSYFWERMLSHSIRPGFEDGFLIPYNELMEAANNNPDINPEEYAVVLPPDAFSEFSYSSELLSSDRGISVLLETKEKLEKMAKVIEGRWTHCIEWIDQELGRLWDLRGPYPGLGPMLGALGVHSSNSISYDLLKDWKTSSKDPWERIEQLFKKPDTVLNKKLAPKIGEEHIRVFKNWSPKRREFFRLLSRFNISREQASCFLDWANDEPDYIDEVIENPYRLFLDTRLHSDPVTFDTIDRGVFPPANIRELINDESSSISTLTNAYRLTAVVVDELELSASQGNTLTPFVTIAEAISTREFVENAVISKDILRTAESKFKDEVLVIESEDGVLKYQLERLTEFSDITSGKIKKRLTAGDIEVKQSWDELLTEILQGEPTDSLEEKAREEKIAALEILAKKRFSVLVGPAGTGKTTLLKTLCRAKSISNGGVLLLAPTGKARVQMEDLGSSESFQAQTIAQFLGQSSRFDFSSQRYQLSEEEPVSCPETVIIDECSMLTEEMIGSLFEGMKSVKRLILVGDPSQLPPIGPGRPFLDIIRHIKPEGIEAFFPRSKGNYCELTIHRRQVGSARSDVDFAKWFSGQPVLPGDDQVLSDLLGKRDLLHLKLVQWKDEHDLTEKLMNTIQNELGMSDDNDLDNFEVSLGAAKGTKGETLFFNKGAAKIVEGWQILTPQRGHGFGSKAINRLIKDKYRRHRKGLAKRNFVAGPFGNEEITYGDKVINVRNTPSNRRGAPKPYPKDGAKNYIANGEIGVVVGQNKTPRIKRPWQLQVEFASQLGFTYGFEDRHFSEEADASMELAYALTIHKCQGSDQPAVLVPSIRLCFKPQAFPNPLSLFQDMEAFAPGSDVV